MPKTVKLKMQPDTYNDHTYIANTVLAKIQTRHYAQTI